MMNSKLINEKVAAEQLGISVYTLRTYRCTNRVSIPFIKIGKSVRYRVEDLEKFIESSTRDG